MATHEYPDLENKPARAYFKDPRLQPVAIQAEELLRKCSQLKFWKVQHKREGIANSCWYLGLPSKKEPFLLSFTLIPSDIHIDFRYPKYLPRDVSEQLKFRNPKAPNWRYASLKEFGQVRVCRMIEVYVARIRDDFEGARVKQGGRSFAEEAVTQCVQAAFPRLQIETNKKLDAMRSALNKPLELDLYLPTLKLGIEIQGPQHFEEVHGPNAALKENDEFKKRWCRQNGVKLVWMKWEDLNRSLLKRPFAEQTRELKTLLSRFLAGRKHFLYWKPSVAGRPR